MPLVIGLTGGIGSGKSTVAAILKGLGAGVIDTDEIAHRLTASGQAGALEIGSRFGSEYLLPDGALDRGRMRSMVFSDPAAKQKLEAILHPLIRAEVNAAVQASQAPYTVIAVPLLIETGAYGDIIVRVLVVDCDEETQIRRVMARSGLSAAAVQAIIKTQASRAARLQRADDVISNQDGLDVLRADIEALHRRYMKITQTPGQAR